MPDQINMYRSVHKTTPVKVQDISQFVLKHKNEDWMEYRELIKQIRSVDPVVDKIRYGTLKKQLPGATISGIFSERKIQHLIKHTGFICIDIDMKPGINKMLLTTFDRNELKKKLIKEPWVYAIMLSVGGRGLAIIIKIEPKVETHEAFYNDIRDYLLKKYSVTTDDACTDLTRFRYISYDPDVYLNEDATTYELANASFDFGENVTQEKSEDKKVKDIEYFTDGRRDNDAFTVANSLIKTGGNKGFAIAALNQIIHGWDNVEKDFARKKVESAMKRHSDKALAEDVNKWVMSTQGTFMSTDVDRELALSTRVDKANRSKILSRMVKEGLIERVGTKNGLFRKVEAILEPMNWQEEDTSASYDLILPLDLHKMMDFNPGNIIMVAGVKETGKTAFALNIAWLNKHKSIDYFNSEMGNQELKKRVMSFPDATLESWDHVNFYNRISNHSDVIDPDALTVIDFLEISAKEGFFSIVDVLRSIHDKIVMGKGVVVIFMQKKKGEEYAVGGHFSAQKARVYFNLESQEVEIKHCKSPKLGTPASGKKIKFTLVNGVTFTKKEKLL